MEFSRYLKVIQGRIWVVIITAIITTAIVGVRSFTTPPFYTSTTKMRVIPFSINAPDYGTFVYFDRLANTYSEILNSSIVQDQAEKLLGIEKLKDYRIETIPQTELMKISVDANSPELAQRIANTLATLLIEENQKLARGEGGVVGDLKQRVDQLGTDITKLISERTRLLDEVPRDNERIAAVDRNIEANMQTYSLALASYNKALESRTAAASALSVIEPATLAEEATGPSRGRDLILGWAIGLMGGIAMAFVLEGLNGRLYTDKQIEALAQAPVIGKIPPITRRDAKNVFEHDPAAAEAFRRLNANLFASSRDVSIRSLLVTSAVTGESKSTVAANLALSIADMQQPVLLIDCDLRMPTLHTYFDLPNNVGLSDVLEGRVPLRDAVKTTSVPGLTVLPSGPGVSDAAELFDSQRMGDLLTYALQDAGMIVLEGPPMLLAADSAVLAPFTDGVVLALNQKRSGQDALASAQRQLGYVNAFLLGVVVTGAPRDKYAQEYTRIARHYRRSAAPVFAVHKSAIPATIEPAIDYETDESAPVLAEVSTTDTLPPANGTNTPVADEMAPIATLITPNGPFTDVMPDDADNNPAASTDTADPAIDAAPAATLVSEADQPEKPASSKSSKRNTGK